MMTRVFVHEHLSATADGPGGLVDAGLAMRDAVVRDLLDAGDCAVSVATGPAAAAVPEGATAVESPAGDAAFDFVGRESRRHDRVWVIAPETDGVLGRLQAEVDPRRWIGCDRGAVSLAASKRATTASATRHGLLTPRAFETGARWIVKPDDGAGALATVRHDSLAAAQDDAAARLGLGQAPTLEAWVDGEPLSLSLLCTATQTTLLAVNRQRLAIDAAGCVDFVGVDVAALAVDDLRTPSLRAWARDLRRAVPGLRGFVGVDLVWHPSGKPVLIEVNPRVTMAFVGLSAAIGCNVAALVLAAHDEEAVDAVA